MIKNVLIFGAGFILGNANAYRQQPEIMRAINDLTAAIRESLDQAAQKAQDTAEDVVDSVATEAEQAAQDINDRAS